MQPFYLPSYEKARNCSIMRTHAVPEKYGDLLYDTYTIPEAVDSHNKRNFIKSNNSKIV
jgi:hypothetical protein